MKSRSGLLVRACLQALQPRVACVPAVTAAMLFFAGAALAGDRFGREIDFDIPSQPLEAALLEFSRQADVQVMMGSAALGGVTSVPLKGRLAVNRALEALLQQSGFGYEARGNTVTVRPVVASIPASVLRLGQAPAGAASDGVLLASTDPAASLQAQSEPPRTVEVLDEIVVTGTHIRGESSAGSQVLVLDRRDMDATGYGTVQDVLNTVPQNFGGGVSEDFSPNAAGNFSRGAGVNLRALGSDATLVLVNGRRQPLSGTEGYFVDISSIPSSAVERVEVLPDGASAIYGSDAIGGVVNIVLRDDYDGAETRARVGMADDANEWSASQVFGKTWSSGNVLIGYQYNQQDVLARADRDYTSTADQTRFGGDDFRWVYGNPGNIFDPLTFLPAFAIPAGQDGRSLTPGDLLTGVANRVSPLEGADLRPEQKIQSGYVTASQQLSERLSIGADARYSERRMSLGAGGVPAILIVPPSNAFYVDAFGDGSPLIMGYSMLHDLGSQRVESQTDTFAAALSLTLDLSGGWRLRASGGYGEEKMGWSADDLYDVARLDVALADPDPATAFNPFADGSATNPATLDAIRDAQLERSHSTASSFNLIADGAVFDLPGGAAKLAAGIDYREERLRSHVAQPLDVQHDVIAGFAELALPVLASASAGGEPALELSLAARYEDYSDFGASTDPKIGLSWVPHPVMRMRATWGTSFKAPRLSDINETPATTTAGLSSYPDPQSPVGSSIVLVRDGKNAELQEETAEIWTAGFDLRFTAAATTLSLTYFDIDYRDRISAGGPASNPFAILLQEEQWTEIIRRNPSQAEIDALCQGPQFVGDPAACSATRPVAIIDFRLHNLGSLAVQGLDLGLATRFSTAAGDIELGVQGTHLLEYQRFASEGSPGFDLVDTVGNPPALRLRASAAWHRQAWSTNAFVNYTGAYTDDVSVPHRRVDSWTTVDLRLAWRAQGSSWLRDTEFALSATNVFDELPPFVNTESGYDVVNADLVGRVISAQFSKGW